MSSKKALVYIGKFFIEIVLVKSTTENPPLFLYLQSLNIEYLSQYVRNKIRNFTKHPIDLLSREGVLSFRKN
jgi:hypothetical protein